MKRMILLGICALTLPLAACSNSIEKQHSPTIYQVNADVLTLEERAELKKQQEIEQKHAIHYAQLYNVLNEAVTSFGITSNLEATKGIYYANLIDLNKDGYEELYLLVKNDGTVNSQRASGSLVQEVWTHNVDEQTAALSYSSQLPAFDELNALTLTLQKGKNQAVISELKASVNEATPYSTEKIIVLNQDSKQATEKIFANQNGAMLINNAATETTEFAKALNAYRGEAVPVLTTNHETKKYSITNTDIKQLLDKLLQGAHEPYINK